MARIYCDENCRDSYHCDQRYGVIYQAITVLKADVPADRPLTAEDILEVVPWRTYARRMRLCRYCQAALPEPNQVPPQIPGQLELPPTHRAASAAC